MRANCVVFAVLLYWRRRRRQRSYLMVRRSRWGPFPHVLYAEHRHGRLRLIGYVPLAPRRKGCPPPWFRGWVKWGDS